MQTRLRIAIASAVLLALTAALAMWRAHPQVDDSDTPVSLANLKRHVSAIAAEPHPVGSEANRRVRDYIIGELEALGLAPEVQTGAMISMRGRGETVENIVCVIPGQSPGGSRGLLACHYDSHPAAPGAGDDANAVAGMLEVARLLVQSGAPRRDIVLLVTDGEEAGLLGARIWVEQHADLMGCAVVANFEARGTSGPAIMFETAGAPRGMFHDAYARTLQPVTSSLAAAVYERMPNGTDFTVFRRAGMSGLNFAFIGGVENYHTPNDDAAHLSDASLLHQAQQMHAIATYFATASDAQWSENDPDRAMGLVYFDVLSLFVIAYPQWLAWPLAILAMAAALAGAYRQRTDFKALARGVAGHVLMLVIVVAWVHLLMQAPMDRAAIGAIVPALAGAALLALAALPWAGGKEERGERGAISGMLLVMTPLVAMTTALLPAGSYVLTWPALLTGAAACLGDNRWRASAMALAGAVATLILLPLAWLVTQALTIRLLGVGAALLVMLLWTWRPALAPLLQKRWWTTGVCFVLAAGCFTLVLLT